MADHPTSGILEGYVRGTLPPDELLEVDEHIAHCQACRGHMSVDARAAASAWQTALNLTGSVDHPSYEQLEAYVDGRLDPVDREVIQAHSEGCASCAAELGDLRTLRASLADTTAPATTRTRTWFMRLALPIGLAGIVWALLPQRAGERNGEPVTRGIERPAPPAPVIVAAVQDGARTVQLDAQGGLAGLPTLAEAEQVVIARALQEGRLPRSSRLRDIVTAEQTLLGAGGGAAAFAVTSPRATAVESDRPEFAWQALADATSYVVTVYDEDLNLAAESPALATVRWVPTTGLRRGRVYNWQVRAMTAQGEALTPSPPAPEARFAIISAAEAEQIATVRRDVPVSRLRLAIAYANAGMLDAAEGELEALRQANPSSGKVTALIDSLRDLRRPAN